MNRSGKIPACLCSCRLPQRFSAPTGVPAPLTLCVADKPRQQLHHFDIKGENRAANTVLWDRSSKKFSRHWILLKSNFWPTDRSRLSLLPLRRRALKSCRLLRHHTASQLGDPSSTTSIIHLLPPRLELFSGFLRWSEVIRPTRESLLLLLTSYWFVSHSH